MATEPATAVPIPGTTTAAETSTPTPEPQATAGAESGVTAPAAENHPDPNLSPTAGDQPTGSETDRLLAGATSVDDILRISAAIPPVGATTPEPTPAAEDGEITLPADGSLPDRIRTKHLTPAQRDAINKVLRNQDPDATAPAGTTPAPEASADPAPAAPADSVPATTRTPVVVGPPPTQTVAGVRAEIAEKRKQQSAALRAADMDRSADLNDEIAALEDTIPTVQRAEAEYEGRFNRAVRESQAEAIDLYPDVRNRDSALVKEMIRLDEQWGKEGHPSYNSTDKPFALTAQAAARLGIAPRKKGGEPPAAGTAPAPSPNPTTPPKPSPLAALAPRAATPAVTPPAPAPGSARTTAPSPTAAQAQSEQVLASMKDANDVLALTRGL